MSHRKSTILIVDADGDLRVALAEQIELQDDFRAEHAGSANAGVAKAKKGDAALLLVAADLPDLDGPALCKELRRCGVRAPIIALAGSGGEAEGVACLEAGANDFVAKPYKFSVLLARIRTHLRSHEQSAEAVFQLGPYEFQPAAKALVDGKKKRIRLTDKETLILKYLYRAGASVVGREELLREVWGYSEGVTTHTLETHIYRLRRKIEADPANPSLLATALGGYRLAP